jgi:hypothetical protein
MKNNLFDTISADVAKGEFSERYLMAGNAFAIDFSTPVINEMLAKAASERNGDAHLTLQEHFYRCKASSMDVLFQDNASGEFNHDGIIVEFDAKLIRSEKPMYRVHFKRLDAACLKQSLRNLQKRVANLERKVLEQG